MSNNRIIFLRHTKTKVDQEIPVSQWDLAEDGINQIQSLMNDENLINLDIIYSSKERKAILTASYFAKRDNIKILQCKEFNELDRDKGKFTTNEGYKEFVKKSIGNFNQSFNNWEKAGDALTRFDKKVREIDSKFTNKKILIVSHGIVLNLFFAKVLTQTSKTFDRWLANSFNNKESFSYYGIIKNGKIVKDILQS